MARDDTEYLAFNRGVVSKLALARTDIKRVAMAAEVQTNFMPRVLGPMSLRPGLEYIGPSIDNNLAVYLPFVFSVTDTALIELTNNKMRVIVNDSYVLLGNPATQIGNGAFNTNLTSWTDNDEVGGDSSWATGGYMSLLGNGSASAIRDQMVTITFPSDYNTKHTLRIVIIQGECILRVGSTTGGSDYIAETTLRTGVHLLSFTPATQFNVRLQARTTYATLVDSCQIHRGSDQGGQAEMEIPTPWGESVLRKVRSRQSADVLFLACEGIKQKRIERRGVSSWSVVDYEANLGPFRVDNATSTTLVPSALNGTVTLTASAPVFRNTNVGGLFSIESTGQAVTRSITSADVYSDPIRVTGISTGRQFSITITGTWSGTVTLQRSVGAVGAWVDVSTYTANTSTTLSDGLDNQIVFYRIGIKPAQYTSGTAVVGLGYSAGSIRGVARVTAYTSELQVTAVVLKDFGALTPTTNWAEGAWSDRRGYPSAVGIYEGRVWWAGKDKIYGSVSDDFANYDDSVTGDSAPISRSIGVGPVDTINWLLEGQQLLMGAQGAEFICRSSSLGEPLTNVNFNLKEATTRGSQNVDAVKVDTSCIFVDRSGSRVIEMEYDSVGSTYTASDLTEIVPEIGLPGVIKLAVQRRPDTRIHALRSDGTVAVLVHNKAEDVRAWVEVETLGDIVDVVILPGDEEDRVYYAVRRDTTSISGYSLEKWAKQSECVGGEINKQADCFIEYDGVATTTIPTGSNTFAEGVEVVCWADGKDMGIFTVSSNAITLPTPVTKAIVGLAYVAQYQGVKSNFLTKKKKFDRVGLVLFDTHNRGLKFGQDFDHLDDMPLIEDFEQVDPDKVWSDYEFESVALDSTFNPNARLCLQAEAPRPCTVGAIIARRTVSND